MIIKPNLFNPLLCIVMVSNLICCFSLFSFVLIGGIITIAYVFIPKPTRTQSLNFVIASLNYDSMTYRDNSFAPPFFLIVPFEIYTKSYL